MLWKREISFHIHRVLHSILIFFCRKYPWKWPRPAECQCLQDFECVLLVLLPSSWILRGRFGGNVSTLHSKVLKMQLFHSIERFHICTNLQLPLSSGKKHKLYISYTHCPFLSPLHIPHIVFFFKISTKRWSVWFKFKLKRDVFLLEWKASYERHSISLWTQFYTICCFPPQPLSTGSLKSNGQLTFMNKKVKAEVIVH